jgi:hypothetical protein
VHFSLLSFCEVTVNESEYQSRIITRVKDLLPGCVVIKNDSSYMPGIPDLLILHGDKWAMLEVKLHDLARHQPNQDYYVDLLDEMGFAAFIHPDIEEAILHDLQCSFGFVGKARLSKSK